MYIAELYPLLWLCLRCNGMCQETANQTLGVVPRQQRRDDLDASFAVASRVREIPIKQEESALILAILEKLIFLRFPLRR